MTETTDRTATIVRADDVPAARESWGTLYWMVGEKEMPGAEQTFGIVEILPGERNPLHSHPNCEELLYVMSGTCEHLLGEEVFEMGPGSIIRIPRGVRHWARCTSDEPLRAVIAFSAPDRQAINHEGEGSA